MEFTITATMYEGWWLLSRVKGNNYLLAGVYYLFLKKEKVILKMNVLLVMIGGFFGAISRFALGEWLLTNNGVPLGTFIVNLIGCFLIGWLLTFASQKKKIKPEHTLIIGTGFIGSFTTFSTFSVETLHLFQQGLLFQGLLYVFATTILGLALVYLGRKMALLKGIARKGRWCHIIWVIGIGGSLGAAVRFLLGNLITRRAQKVYPFPMGTWVINITGSFLFGFITQLHYANQISEWLWFFSGVGFCGAYTTFSTFGNETITLIYSNKLKLAVIYVGTSLITGVISAMIGFYIILL